MLSLCLGLLTQVLFLLGGWLWVEQMGNGVQEEGSTLFYWANVHSHSTICFHKCGLTQSSQQLCGVGITINGLLKPEAEAQGGEKSIPRSYNQ